MRFRRATPPTAGASAGRLTSTLTNCAVSANSATEGRGVIGNSGDVVVINNSTLSLNAGSFPAAIEKDGGRLTINASTLSGNSTAFS